MLNSTTWFFEYGKKFACEVFQECFLTKKTKRIFYNLSFWIENSGIVRSGENSKTPTKIFSNTFIYPPLSCFSFLLQLWNEKKWFEMRNFFFWSLPVWNNRGSVVCILKSMKQADVAPTINSEHQMLCINHVKSVVAKCLFLNFFCSMNERGSIFDD